MRLEFYNRRNQGLIVSVKAESCPSTGDKVSIRGTPWLVVTRSWAVDHADDARTRELRVCLNCDPTDGDLEVTSHE